MSRAEALVALTEKPGGTGLSLCSPAVGVAREIPGPGRILGGGDPFATLIVLGHAHPLLVPEGITGVVSKVEVAGFGNDTIPVEYAQPLVTLAPIDALNESGEAIAGVAGAEGGATTEALPEGCHAVICPTDGVFYRRPRPTDPAYVEAGSSVRTGQTLGLIEAMKTFSPIPYGGPGLPSPASVVEIRAEDNQEVRHGQVLFVVR